jgi:hypothetical protein
MQVGCGNCGCNLSTVGLHLRVIKWHVMGMWRCSFMNINYLCARSLTSGVSHRLSGCLFCHWKQEYTRHEMWIQRVSKMTGLGGSLEATKHFRYRCVAPTDAGLLWGRWWVLPHTEQCVCLDLLQLLKLITNGKLQTFETHGWWITEALRSGHINTVWV